MMGMKSPKRAMEGMVWKIPATCKTQLLVKQLEKEQGAGSVMTVANVALVQ